MGFGAELRSNEGQAFVTRPEAGGAQPGGGKEMGLDIAEPGARQRFTLDQA
jgi:hypothetical protein